VAIETILIDSEGLNAVRSMRGESRGSKPSRRIFSVPNAEKNSRGGAEFAERAGALSACSAAQLRRTDHA